MEKSLLVRSLKGLSAAELSRFGEFVHSPYFNKREDLNRLCACLLAFGPAFEDPGLEKKQFYRTVFGAAEYRELPFNNLISDLLKLLYEFVALEELSGKESLKKDLLLGGLLERDMPQQAERQIKSWSLVQEKRPHRNFDYYYGEYRRFEQQDRLNLGKGKRGYDESLQQASDHLDRYYVANKLRIACDMTSRNAVVQAGYECHHLDLIQNMALRDSSGLQEDPAFQVYAKTLDMLRGADSSRDFQELKHLLIEKGGQFPRWELRTLYNYALNFCVRQINSGRTDYYREIWDLYQALLKENILFTEGHLTQWTYINIITAGIRLQEYDWTEAFIHAYKDYLLPEEQYNVYTYNLAALYFERKDYGLALQTLHDVEFTDAFYHLAAKIIQLKSYYELEETEAFFSLAEASRKFLSRNRQLSEYQKRSNEAFLRLARRLYEIRLRSGLMPRSVFAAQVEGFRKKLDEVMAVANKDWLEQAADRLIQQKKGPSEALSPE
ncbi:MAG TPA: hypothetical protein PKB07_16240 [Flavilitoribacter sp.]|nr:hypothetical protein [Flavilitoribacter sp.]